MPMRHRNTLPALLALAALTAAWQGPLSAPLHAQVVADPYAAADAAYQSQDYATAHKLWLGLAEDGNASAYFNLGRLYTFGEGVSIDLLEAYKWFTLADRGGVPQAKAGLDRVGRLMTPSDITEAERRIQRWYDLHPATRR